MRVITVARKPLAGTVAATCLKFGTGGINIDATRIGLNPGYKYNADRNGTTFHGQVGERIRQTADKKGAETIESTKGRWPANLLLCHKTGCRCVGTSQEKGYAINTWDDGSKPFGGGAGHPYSSRSSGDIENEVWKCVGDCPVRELDRQSGNKTGASAPVKGTEGSDPTDRVYGKYERVPGAFHGDTGGASRFFKQVRE